jgi:hypothetical protein
MSLTEAKYGCSSSSCASVLSWSSNFRHYRRKSIASSGTLGRSCSKDLALSVFMPVVRAPMYSSWLSEKDAFGLIVLIITMSWSSSDIDYLSSILVSVAGRGDVG